MNKTFIDIIIVEVFLELYYLTGNEKYFFICNLTVIIIMQSVVKNYEYGYWLHRFILILLPLLFKISIERKKLIHKTSFSFFMIIISVGFLLEF